MPNHLGISLIFSLQLFFAGKATAQIVTLYDNPKAIEKVQYATDLIYAMKHEQAKAAIEEVQEQIPYHPSVPLLRAIHTLWRHIPILDDTTFDSFKKDLYTCVDYAQQLGDDHPEGIYFEMAARGLLAEYYADRGLYMSAVNEASRAYTLLKKGFKLTDEVPDFLFAAGIYNYFREVYPEKYPIYKSLVWFFKSGDREKGIQQIRKATTDAILVSVEAHIYLGYIYLRYEETPVPAQKYLRVLVNRYPDNLYAHAKYLESLHDPAYYDQIDSLSLHKLKSSDRPYYMLAGYQYDGLYHQHVLNQPEEALDLYTKAIEWGEKIPSRGEYYKSYAYFGAGQILKARGEKDKADYYFEEALDRAQTDELKEEVKREL